MSSDLYKLLIAFFPLLVGGTALFCWLVRVQKFKVSCRASTYSYSPRCLCLCLSKSVPILLNWHGGFPPSICYDVFNEIQVSTKVWVLPSGTFPPKLLTFAAVYRSSKRAVDFRSWKLVAVDRRRSAKLTVGLAYTCNGRRSSLSRGSAASVCSTIPSRGPICRYTIRYEMLF